MVPTAPFKDHILRWVNLLNHHTGNGGVHFQIRKDNAHARGFQNKLAHIHGLRIIGHKQNIAIRQNLKIVLIGNISIPGPVTIDHLVMGVHKKKCRILLIKIRQQPIRLFLEIKPGLLVCHRPVINDLPLIIQDQQIGTNRPLGPIERRYKDIPFPNIRGRLQ